MKINLNNHPWDWIIHEILCFTPIYFNWATWFVVVFVAIMIEYEQWKYAGKPELIHYFFYQIFSDLIADAIGIIGALLCLKYLS